MKSTLPFVALLAFAICIHSCKKTKTPDPTLTNPKKKYLSQSIQIFQGATFITTYTYDSQKRLASVKRNTSTSPVTTTYSYDGSNRLIGTEQTLTSEGVVWRTVTTISYDESNVHQNVKIYGGNDLNKEINTDYVFEGDKIKETHSDNGVVNISTYDANGNAIKSESNSGYTTVSTYTDKKNPAKRFTTPGIYSSPSPNLIASTVTTTSQSKMTTIYTYTFDAKGYVSTVFADQDLDDHNDITTTYAYDEDGYVTAESLEYTNGSVANTKYAYTYVEL
ncbi:MAG TPA: hypothetical protein VIQ77_12030 [Mucilaginibacter sp.]